MKARIVLAIVIALSMGSWVNTHEKTQIKGKDSVYRDSAPAPGEKARKERR